MREDLARGVLGGLAKTEIFRPYLNSGVSHVGAHETFWFTASRGYRSTEDTCQSICFPRQREEKHRSMVPAGRTPPHLK